MNSGADPVLLLLVPARGGSKGIPRKNLAPLGGRPLLAWVLETAAHFREERGGARTRLVVSTDDASIGAEASSRGAEVPWLRPPELATDDTPMIDVVFHALDRLAEHGFAPDLVALLQPTTPFLAVDDVRAAVELARTTGAPVVGVTENEHPLEWMFVVEESRLRPVRASGVTRRQDAVPVYRLNGAVYVATPGHLRTEGAFVGAATRPHVMPPERSVDIDTPHDLAAAEAWLAVRGEST